MLLRLSPSGWCRAIERLVLIDEAAAVAPAHEAAVLEASEAAAAAPLPNPVDLKDHLKRQALGVFSRRDFGVAANLIEEIDSETGLFSGELQELSIALGRPEDDLADILSAINHLHPGGCGASSYRQALRCQIPELPEEYPGDVARQLLTDYWETFSQGGREILSEISGFGYQAIEDGVEAIRRHLTPYPAERFWGRNGSHLKRAFYHVEERESGRVLSSPPASEWCFVCKPREAKDGSLIALEALKLRRRACAGVGAEFAGVDFDDSEARVELSAFASAAGLSEWAAWTFSAGELILDSAGERRYMRTILTVADARQERLFAALDREAEAGRAGSDAELAAQTGRPGKPLDAKEIAALRKSLGIPGRATRGNSAVRALLSYERDA